MCTRTSKPGRRNTARCFASSRAAGDDSGHRFFLVTPGFDWVDRLVCAAPPLLRPWSVLMAPAGTRLVIPPTAVDVTLNDTVQDAPAARLAMESETEVPTGATDGTSCASICRRPGSVPDTGQRRRSVLPSGTQGAQLYVGPLHGESPRPGGTLGGFFSPSHDCTRRSCGFSAQLRLLLEPQAGTVQSLPALIVFHATVLVGSCAGWGKDRHGARARGGGFSWGPRFGTWRPAQRSTEKNARISSSSSCGCSSAAKCPPAGISVQRWMLKRNSAHARGARHGSFGNTATAVGTSTLP